jgi:TRAP-type C4-dicarboxylate transport system permease small subunit
MSKTFLQKIDALTEYVGMLFLCIMCVVILLQIICRYVFNNALAWPEEVARFSFIWATYFAISMCMKGDQHLRITLLQTLISKNACKAVDILCMLINAAFFVACVYLSIDLTIKVYETEQIAVSMPLPIWVVWIAIPLGCLLTLLQTLREMVRLFQPSGTSD